MSACKDFPHLFSPIEVGSKVYKNRVIAAPLGGVSVSPQGGYPAASFQTYRDRAEGGFAEVAASETVVDFQYGNRLPVPVVDYTDLDSPHMKSLRDYPEMLHRHGVIATVELNHCGMRRMPSAGEAIGPSGFLREDGVAVREMDEVLMQYVADSFAMAAYYYKCAGYDGCMPHMASGWLLQQFFSPVTNRRTDEYGGSVENRARFPLRVLRAIREKCGADFLIIPRISAEENIPGGYTIQDTLTLCRMMEGLVDMVHVMAGVYYEPIRSLEYSSMYHPHGLHAHLAEAIKRECSFPVAVCGGMNSPEQAEALIAEGKTDLVALGRQLLADVNWPKKAASGKASDIARCVRCFRCFPGPLQDTGGKMLKPPDKKCTVNPKSDLSELDPPLSRWPAPQTARQVLVVGGGIAGLYASYTAAQRGHRVTLAEQSDTLGGLLTFTDYDSHKEDLRNFKELCIRRVESTGVKILLNTAVTPENVADFGAETVILALGSVPRVPKIPGISCAISLMEAYRNTQALGSRLIIAGGGQAGCELALHLAETGRQITVVEMQPSVAPDAEKMHRVALMDRLESAITLCTGLTCAEFLPNGLRVLTPEGDTQLLVADGVILALGMQANYTPAQELQAALPEGTQVFRVGDCVRPGKIHKAVEDGFLAAMAIV